MNNRKKTVAIIPNYNGQNFLASCLDALLSQEPVAPDIIIVDNNSTDGSVDFIKQNYPQVRLIELAENKGFGAAVNHGIKETDHELIALVNNDATVQPGWLAALEQSLNAKPDAGAYTPKVLFQTTENIIDSAGDTCTPYGFIYKRGHHEHDEGQFDVPEEIFSVSAVATLFRRSLFDRIGLFDENFFAYYEDLDLCLRGRLAGFKFYYEPSAIALHHYSATSGSQMKLGTEEVYIYITGIWIKDMPARLLLRHLPSVIIFHSTIFFAVLLARIRRKSKLPPVPVIRFLFAMIGKRREVQNNISISNAELERLMSRKSVWFALGSRLIKAFGRK